MSDYTYEYLPLRGIESRVMKFYDIPTKIDSEGKPVEIGFRYPNDAYKVRTLGDKDFRTTKNAQGEGPEGLFGRDKFTTGSGKYVTITEGELDAASLYQVVQGPVVSVRNAATARGDCSADRAWLNSFERVYLAFDNDQPGRDATHDVAKLFDYNKVFVVKFDRRKDANEYLQHDEGSELRNLWWTARKYQPESIINTLDEFEKILQKPVQKGLDYPFKKLTDMTYGIRTSETVLFKAQEKVGKTELMHFILHKILRDTDDNVGAIFLEEPKQRLLQAMAGITLGKQTHLPDCNCTAAEVSSAVRSVVRRDDRLNIYSHFGSNDPEVLLDTIRFLVSANSCRYIILDHITMAVSGLAGEDERRALDYLSTRLEMMVKELDFALIMVSHVNDEGRTRGSRYLTKVADITVDAARDTMAADPEVRSTITLSIPFNRFCGRSGYAGSIIFNPETYSFIEKDLSDAQGANDNWPSQRLAVA